MAMAGDGGGLAAWRLGGFVFGCFARWRGRCGVTQKHPSIRQGGEHGAANAGAVVGLICRTKWQQGGDGDDGQLGGVMRCQGDRDIAPFGHT